MIETSDSELLMLISENNEEAQKVLYTRYKKIIDKMLYNKIIIMKTLNITYNEIYTECLNALNSAIESYFEKKGASFKTYATLLINRAIKKTIIKYSCLKNKIITEAYSLDFSYDDCTLEEIIKDERVIDPLKRIIDSENIAEVKDAIKGELSLLENEVFVLMLKNYDYKQIAGALNKTPKQIDNAIQRIKNKLKNKLKESDLY